MDVDERLFLFRVAIIKIKIFRAEHFKKKLYMANEF